MRKLQTFLSIFMTVILIACGGGQNGTDGEAKEKYISQIETKLLKMEDRIIELRDRADEVLTNNEAKFNAEIDTLAQKQDAIEQQFQALKNASAEEWPTIKARIDTMIAEWDAHYEKTRDW